MIKDLIQKWETEFQAFKHLDAGKAKLIKSFLSDLYKMQKAADKTINMFGEEKK